MATQTPNLGLTLPVGTENVSRTVINGNNTLIDTFAGQMGSNFGILETGDTATHAIAKGEYVTWKGASYTADAAISIGETLAATGGSKNLTACDKGIANALNSNIAQLGGYVAGTKNAVNCPNNGATTTIGTITLNKGRWIVFVSGWSPLGDVKSTATQITVSNTYGSATIPFRLFSTSGLAHINSDNTVLNLYVTNWESQAKTSETAYNFYATRVGF